MQNNGPIKEEKGDDYWVAPATLNNIYIIYNNIYIINTTLLLFC